VKSASRLDLGSATVPVAAVGPRASVCPTICSVLPPTASEDKAFGQRPKAAVETTALPKKRACAAATFG
jgi:hypothetical protein